MKMRREEKDFTSPESIEKILSSNKICRLALVDENMQPYVIPMNFVHVNNVIYMHSAKTGRKINILKEQNKVCIEIDESKGIRPVNSVENDAICNTGSIYRSLIGEGIAGLLEDPQLKKRALMLMCDKFYQHIGEHLKFNMNDKHIAACCIIAVKLTHIKVKQSGDWD